MRTALALCLVLFTSVNSIQAQDKPIDELKIDKVGLKTSLQDFLKMHPKAERTKHDDDKYGVKAYIVMDPNGECFSGFNFFENELSMMLVFWTPKGLKDAGGWRPIVESIVKKYGKADADSPGIESDRAVFRWVSPDTANTLVVIKDDKGLSIGLINRKQENRLNEAKAKQAKRKFDD